jgi:hypothetical protein
VNNPVTGETISLTPCAAGQTADRAMNQRYGHPLPGETGVASWRLGTPSTYVTLSAADVAVIYVPMNTFGSTGALAAPVTTALADELTIVRANYKAATVSANPTAMLEIAQGGASVFLTQQNAADLAPQLNAIGAT